MYTLDDIKKEDQEIASAITDEFDRQNSHIELIASENWVSPAVMSAMGSILTNKYAEGYPRRQKLLFLRSGAHRVPCSLPFHGSCQRHISFFLEKKEPPSI